LNIKKELLQQAAEICKGWEEIREEEEKVMKWLKGKQDKG
jgi:hypothetical protein